MVSFQHPNKFIFCQKHLDCSLLWNAVLDWRSKEYSLKGNKINYLKTNAKLTEMKQETEWLNEVSSVALQQTLRNQEAAFSNFFAKRAEYPTFKKKNNNQSFRLALSGFSLKDGELFIAKNKQPVNVRWSRPLEGEVSSLTISKDCANRYFVSFCSEVEIEPLPEVNKNIGIDLGLTDFLITSDGEKVKPLKSFIKYQKKVRKANKELGIRRKKT